MDFWQNLPQFNGTTNAHYVQVVPEGTRRHWYNGTINTHYVQVVPEGLRRHWYKTDRKSVLDIGPFGRVTPPPVEVASTSMSATSQKRIPSVTPEANQSMTSKSAQQRKQSSSFKTDSEFTVLNLSTQTQRKASWPSWNITGWSKQHMWGMWGQLLVWRQEWCGAMDTVSSLFYMVSRNMRWCLWQTFLWLYLWALDRIILTVNNSI